MIKNPKFVKLFKGISIGLFVIVIGTLIINEIEPNIEFPNVEFDRLWGYIVCYFYITSFIIILLVLKSFSKTTRIILLIIGIPTVLFAIWAILIMNAKIWYQPHYDRYKVYSNLNKPYQYVLVQDYTKWKLSQPAVDTTLIIDFILLRKYTYLETMNVKGTWLKFNEKGEIIDTVKIE